MVAWLFHANVTITYNLSVWCTFCILQSMEIFSKNDKRACQTEIPTEFRVPLFCFCLLVLVVSKNEGWLCMFNMNCAIFTSKKKSGKMLFSFFLLVFFPKTIFLLQNNQRSCFYLYLYSFAENEGKAHFYFRKTQLKMSSNFISSFLPWYFEFTQLFFNSVAETDFQVYRTGNWSSKKKKMSKEGFNYSTAIILNA